MLKVLHQDSCLPRHPSCSVIIFFSFASSVPWHCAALTVAVASFWKKKKVMHSTLLASLMKMSASIPTVEDLCCIKASFKWLHPTNLNFVNSVPHVNCLFSVPQSALTYFTTCWISFAVFIFSSATSLPGIVIWLCKNLLHSSCLLKSFLLNFPPSCKPC